MIQRLRVDNFGCLVNFELRLERMQLLLGPNGSGKSTVFDILRRLQRLLGGEPLVGDDATYLDGALPANTLTVWQRLPIQTFEALVSLGDVQIGYELVVEHDTERGRARIKREALESGTTSLFTFENGEVQLHRDDGSPGPTYNFDWSRSALSMVAARPDNVLLTRFRRFMSDLTIVSPCPALMDDMSLGPSGGAGPHPGVRMERFATWYHRLSQDQGLAIRVAETLREVLPGFSHFRFAESGDRWRLMAEMDAPVPHSFRFRQLSDGEMMLAALYVLVLSAPRGGVICIDEPANNIAPPELGPWLDMVRDRCDDGDLQALIISHHPLMVDREAAACGLWLDRPSNGPTRLSRLSDASESPMPLSSLVERGWILGS